MNNFFLLNEALNTQSINHFEEGIERLTTVLTKVNSKTDILLKDPDFWEYKTNLGVNYELVNKLKKEIVGLTYKLFETFNSCSINISSDEEFDILFEGEQNAFKGFDFTETDVSKERQIFDIETFVAFKTRCAQKIGYSSIENFWDNKELLYPSLIFCERVWNQIRHLSITDDRFHLINEKLTKLNSFTKSWSNGVFNYNNLGLDCTPDTPKRIKDTLALRTFDCPEIGQQIFNLHIKWSFGRQFFRLYFYPDSVSKTVFIGYIGPKDEIGF